MPPSEEPPSYQGQKTIKEKIPETWLAATQDFFIPCLTSFAILWFITLPHKQPPYSQVQDISNVPAKANMAFAFTFGVLTKIGLDIYWLRGCLKHQDSKLFDLSLIRLKHTNQVSDEQISSLKFANIELVESGFADLIKTLETVKLSAFSAYGKPQFIFNTKSQSELGRFAAKVKKAYSVIAKIDTNNHKVAQYQERGKTLLKISLDLIETLNNETTSKEKLQSHANDLATLIEQESGNPYLVLILAILGVLLNQQDLYKQTSEYVDHVFSTKDFPLKNSEAVLDGLLSLKLVNMRFNRVRSRRW